MLETFFLACFLFGALFIVASALTGLGQGVHIGHVHLGHASHQSDAPLLSPVAVLGGLTWFGAAGYLLGRDSHLD